MTTLESNENLEISLLLSLPTELCHENSMLGSQNGPLRVRVVIFQSLAVILYVEVRTILFCDKNLGLLSLHLQKIWPVLL